MPDTFYLKRSDTSPVLDYLVKPVGRLTGASCVFNMATVNGQAVIAAEPATILLPATLRYLWRPLDTAVNGMFRAEFRVTYADGRIETFPNNDFIMVNINMGVIAP